MGHTSCRVTHVPENVMLKNSSFSEGNFGRCEKIGTNKINALSLSFIFTFEEKSQIFLSNKYEIFVKNTHFI